MALTHNPYKYQQPRLRYGPSAGEVEEYSEYDISSRGFSYSIGDNGVSSTFEFGLTHPDDVAIFSITDTRYELSFGRRSSAGVWSNLTVAANFMQLAETKHQISFGDNGPTDNVTIVLESIHNAKTQITPERDLIIYDPLLETINEDTLEPIADSNGNFYFPEVIQKVGLSVHYLFETIFVDRCGFSGYQTNIPDDPIKRYDCSAGSSLYNALKGFIGMWEPLIYTEGNKLWIVDTTMTGPSNLPAGRPFTPKTYRSVSRTASRDRIGGLVLQYIENARSWDYFDTVEDPPDSTSTGGISTTIVRQHRIYRKLSMPFVAIRKALVKETTTVKNGDPLFGDTIEEIVNELNYDGQGRLVNRVRTVDSLLPSITGSFALQRSESETETYTYQQHAFKPRQVYCREKKYTRTGLMVWNAGNTYLDEPFKQSLKDAHRSGNPDWDLIMTPGAVRTLPIESRIETAAPLRSGEVRVSCLEFDELAKVVTKQYTEERAGDIGLNALAPSQQRLYVDPDNPPDPNENSRRDPLHIGEVPLTSGLPLAKRVLKQRMDSNGQLEMEGIGYDPAMKIGGVISVYGRPGPNDPSLPVQFIGNYLLTSARILGSPGGAIAASYDAKKI